jgi:hypothetical protein
MLTILLRGELGIARAPGIPHVAFSAHGAGNVTRAPAGTERTADPPGETDGALRHRVDTCLVTSADLRSLPPCDAYGRRALRDDAHRESVSVGIMNGVERGGGPGGGAGNLT